MIIKSTGPRIRYIPKPVQEEEKVVVEEKVEAKKLPVKKEEAKASENK